MDFLILDPQVSHGHGRGRMIKSLAKHFKPNTKLYALLVSPGFPQSMSTVIALAKIDSIGPPFNHLVYVVNSDRVVLPLTTLEEVIPVVTISFFHKYIQGFPDRFVYNQDIFLPVLFSMIW